MKQDRPIGPREGKFFTRPLFEFPAGASSRWVSAVLTSALNVAWLSCWGVCFQGCLFLGEVANR